MGLGSEVFDIVGVKEIVDEREALTKGLGVTDWIGKPLGTPPVVDADGEASGDCVEGCSGIRDLDAVNVTKSGEGVVDEVISAKGVVVLECCTVLGAAD